MSEPKDTHADRPSAREAVAAFPFFLRFVFRSGRFEFVLYLLGSLAQAPLGYIGVLSIQRLTNALASAEIDLAIYWIWVLVAGQFAAAIVSVFVEYTSDILRYRTMYAQRLKEVEIMSAQPLARLEDPTFQLLVEGYHQKSHVIGNVSQWVFWGSWNLFSLLGYGTVFVFLPWQVSALMIAIIALRVWTSNREAMWGWDLFQRERKEGRRAVYFTQNLTTPRVLLSIKSWNLHRHFQRLLKELSDRLMVQMQKTTRKMGTGIAVAEAAQVLGLGVGAYFTIQGLRAGTVSPGSAVAFIAVFPPFWERIGRLMWNVRSILREIHFLGLFKRFFSLPLESDEGASVPRKPLTVRFEDVWFRYPGSEEDVLRGLNLTFTEGEHLALAGLNGAGKSTLLKLLMGVYEPTRGSLTVNGIPLAKIKPSSWRGALAVMAQDQLRFDDTIRAQILYGDALKKEQPEALRAALETSSFDIVLTDLAKGLETHAGKQFAMPDDEAIELSGGQNQLLAIARTLYRDARIYIFDEPTSAVDAEKEERFFEALPEALQSQALLYVSHRFSTLRRAERILVLEQGRIIEDGTHDELMLKKGRYAELFTLQAKLYQ